MLTKYSRFSIFKWYDFSVSGVKHVYDVTDGEKQGEIGDF